MPCVFDLQRIHDIYRPAEERKGRYRSEYEHDACDVGMVANLSGKASHEIVVAGMTILKRRPESLHDLEADVRVAGRRSEII